jgi:hypothetical protein
MFLPLTLMAQIEEEESRFYIEPQFSGGYVTSLIKIDGKVDGLVIPQKSSSGLIFSGGGALGWQFEYVHLLLSTNFGVVSTDAGPSGSNVMGGLLDLGAGFGWEWNIPLMTTFMVKGLKPMKIGEGSSGGSFTVMTASSNTSIGEATATEQIQTFMIGASFPIDMDYPKYWKGAGRLKNKH